MAHLWPAFLIRCYVVSYPFVTVFWNSSERCWGKANQKRRNRLTLFARIVQRSPRSWTRTLVALEREWPELIYRLERNVKAILDEEKRGNP